MWTNSSTDTSSVMLDEITYCFNQTYTAYYLVGFSFINVPFVLPICLYILYLGVQQWRSKANISHTDVFTYNMVIMAIICILVYSLLTLNLFFHRPGDGAKGNKQKKKALYTITAITGTLLVKFGGDFTAVGDKSGSPDESIFAICAKIPTSLYHIIAFILLTVPFVLPLCFYILHLGAQQWKSRANISHTEFFTFNIVINQLICVLGSCLLASNVSRKSELLTQAAICVYFLSSAVTIIFQVLTCLDRYMAVVYPSQFAIFVFSVCCCAPVRETEQKEPVQTKGFLHNLCYYWNFVEMASMNSSFDLSYIYCLLSGIYIVPSFTVLWTFLFFSIYSLVLHTGFQRWRQNKHSTRSSPSQFKKSRSRCVVKLNSEISPNSTDQDSIDLR
ncbi:hypothetical protein WMY93_014680 [Mugilogobius chulae]|uniref:G-protein coupled receptors family 1 profile domain-containing protein n=1 Tax=Mugilogobius chulae TaxID=88201 RepID=A0AAW0NZP6_9GOBI